MKYLLLAIVAMGLLFAYHPDVSRFVPPEYKVVEIHMGSGSPSGQEEKKRGPKTETLPFANSGTCSGAFIDAMGDVLTARHCVSGFETFEVVTYDQRHYTATIVATSTVHDLAMLHIDRRNTPFFALATTVTRGQTVFVLGSPLGITDTLSTGVIARLSGDLMLIDCSALPGNSGGPIFDKNQNLVGVVSAGFVVMLGVTHLNIAQNVDSVVCFVEGALGRKYGA